MCGLQQLIGLGRMIADTTRGFSLEVMTGKAGGGGEGKAASLAKCYTCSVLSFESAKKKRRRMKLNSVKGKRFNVANYLRFLRERKSDIKETDKRSHVTFALSQGARSLSTTFPVLTY